MVSVHARNSMTYGQRLKAALAPFSWIRSTNITRYRLVSAKRSAAASALCSRIDRLEPWSWYLRMVSTGPMAQTSEPSSTWRKKEATRDLLSTYSNSTSYRRRWHRLTSRSWPWLLDTPLTQELPCFLALAIRSWQLTPRWPSMSAHSASCPTPVPRITYPASQTSSALSWPWPACRYTGPTQRASTLSME